MAAFDFGFDPEAKKFSIGGIRLGLEPLIALGVVAACLWVIKNLA
jgi:hypothetical protein